MSDTCSLLLYLHFFFILVKLSYCCTIECMFEEELEDCSHQIVHPMYLYMQCPDSCGGCDQLKIKINDGKFVILVLGVVFSLTFTYRMESCYLCFQRFQPSMP